jgi:hypothetical protein
MVSLVSKNLSVGGLDGVTGFPGTAKSRIGNLYYGVRNKM